jgi:RNA polymerase sigma-70 factor (ECF subfamily)
MLEDKFLIWKFRQGSDKALQRIYEKYRVYLLTIATALLDDTHIAEDVVHDVFLRFADSAVSLRLDGNLKAYLRTCVLNKARNKVRAERVRVSVDIDAIEPVACNENRYQQWTKIAEDSARIQDALAKLVFEQREAVVLHLHGGMKFVDIAKVQGVPLKTVQSRYRYGLEKLRSLLNDEVGK